jgi:hypothetical protein
MPGLSPRYTGSHSVGLWMPEKNASREKIFSGERPIYYGERFNARNVGSNVLLYPHAGSNGR